MPAQPERPQPYATAAEVREALARIRATFGGDQCAHEATADLEGLLSTYTDGGLLS